MATTRIHEAATGIDSAGVFKTAVVAGLVFLLWKTARGLRDLAWAAFGLGMAAYWLGFWPF